MRATRALRHAVALARSACALCSTKTTDRHSVLYARLQLTTDQMGADRAKTESDEDDEDFHRVAAGASGSLYKRNRCVVQHFLPLLFER